MFSEQGSEFSEIDAVDEEHPTHEHAPTDPNHPIKKGSSFQWLTKFLKPAPATLNKEGITLNGTPQNNRSLPSKETIPPQGTQPAAPSNGTSNLGK